MLGWKLLRRTDCAAELGPSTDIGPRLFPLATSDRKCAKNRMHLDLLADDMSTEVERALTLGARPVDIGQRPDARNRVFADPEGNEFCICPDTSI
jgi:hypothetical protein